MKLRTANLKYKDETNSLLRGITECGKEITLFQVDDLVQFLVDGQKVSDPVVTSCQHSISDLSHILCKEGVTNLEAALQNKRA